MLLDTKLAKFLSRHNKIAQLYFQFSGKRYNVLCEQAARFCFINTPLIFISQLSRSGGTLMSQLFDGHNSIAAFPPELKFASHKTSIADMDALARCNHKEVARKFIQANKSVIEKGVKGCYDKGVGNRVPFIFDIYAFNVLFETLWSLSKPNDGRDVMNYWFTSFFSSWLNYQWPYEVKYCSAFASWTGVKADNVDRFFSYYPDGYFIHVLREPISWYESVKTRSRIVWGHHHLKVIYKSLENAIECYKKQAIVFEQNIKRYPGKVVMLTYDSLVSDRKRVMSEICKIIKLDFDDSLLKPTFNKRPCGRNTSFKDGRRVNVLDDHEKSCLYNYCAPLYEKLLSLCI